MSRAWSKFIHPLSRIARRKRAAQILKMYPSFNEARVLDLGGSKHYWEKMIGILEPNDLTLLNIVEDGQSVSEDENRSTQNLKIELYDGKKIPYPDKHFDVVICNSVIEHVPPQYRAALIREIMRVGRAYFVQTPAYAFPIEPHFVMPFVHWMPRSIGKFFVRFGVYAMLSKAPRDKLDAYFEEVQLLTKRELSGYDPAARIFSERLLGLPKSYTLFQIGH